MVGLRPPSRLPVCRFLPTTLHSPVPIFFHSGRPSLAAPAGSSLRVALASGVPPCPGGRSGGLLLPTGTLPWPAAPTGTAAATEATAAAGCPPSSSFLTSCPFASSLPASWPPASATCLPGDPTSTGAAGTTPCTGPTGLKPKRKGAPTTHGGNVRTAPLPPSGAHILPLCWSRSVRTPGAPGSGENIPPRYHWHARKRRGLTLGRSRKERLHRRVELAFQFPDALGLRLDYGR